MFETIFKKLTPDCEPWVLEHTIQLAVELAREGREGHKVGTMFVVGDEEAALKQSKPLILDLAYFDAIVFFTSLLLKNLLNVINNKLQSWIISTNSSISSMKCINSVINFCTDNTFIHQA